MNDFDYEVKQKRELARAAKYRKRGSKSKKCTLLSDYLTQKQLRERNGKVEYYALNAPMTWDTFKTMPDDLKSEYISSLAGKYHCTQADIAEMLGVSKSYLGKEIRRLQCWPFAIGKNPSSARDVRSWLEFVGDFNHPKAERGHAAESADHEIIPAADEPEVEITAPTITLTSGEFTISGRISDVLARVESILGGDNRYTVQIKFEEVA